MTQTPAAPPAGRYGPQRAPRSTARRRAGWVALGVVAVALVAWLTAGVASKDVSWKDVGYHVTDATSTDVTFDVTKPKDATVTCRVQALSQSYGEVGVRTVEVGPADVATRRVTVTVPTTELAVSGTVASCAKADDAP